LNIFDGSDDISLGTFNTSTNVYTPSGVVNILPLNNTFTGSNTFNNAIATPRVNRTTSAGLNLDDNLVLNAGGGTNATLKETLLITGRSGSSAHILLREDTDNGTHSVKFEAPALLTADRTLTPPDASGTIALLSDIASAGQEVELAAATFSAVSNVDMEFTPDDSVYTRGYMIYGYFTVGTTDARPDFLLKVGGVYPTANYSFDGLGGNAAAAQNARSTSAASIRPCSTGTSQGINNVSTASNFFTIFIPSTAESTTIDHAIYGMINFKRTAVDSQTWYNFNGAYNGGTGELTGVRFAPSTGTISGNYIIKGLK